MNNLPLYVTENQRTQKCDHDSQVHHPHRYTTNIHFVYESYNNNVIAVTQDVTYFSSRRSAVRGRLIPEHYFRSTSLKLSSTPPSSVVLGSIKDLVLVFFVVEALRGVFSVHCIIAKQRAAT